jgi:hypothetical protein
MPSDPQTPRTEAGRRLWEAYGGTTASEAIRAIEAEAARDALAGVRAAALPEPLDVEPHEGEPHEFRTICRRCGEPGFLHVSLITPQETVVIQTAAAYQERSRPENET